jgi:hypothetical protein
MFKSGLFSGLAHDHNIQAPAATGNIDLREESVSLTFNLADMKVLDPGVSDSDRNDIDATMKAPRALAGAQFPTISFASSSVKNSGDRNEVPGTLQLHSASRQITVPCGRARWKVHGIAIAEADRLRQHAGQNRRRCCAAEGRDHE